MKLYQLVNASNAFGKLFSYGSLPANDIYHLATMKPKVESHLLAFDQAWNATLAKYGTSKDGVKYDVDSQKAEALKAELTALDNQEIDLTFPPDKITLCVESIDKAERNLPAEKRLGFTANDWLAIREIITVVEKEETEGSGPIGG